MKPLFQNICINLKRTLSNLSSQTEQEVYKSKVPYVHIPDELIAQWESIRVFIADEGLLTRYLDQFLIDELRKFDLLIIEFCKKNRNIDDVPDVFTNKDWRFVMKRAKHLRAVFEEHGPQLED